MADWKNWKNTGWNEERIELLKKLWADGLTASQCANELHGVTRNAVIAKVWRLGLSGRRPASFSGTRKPKPKSQKPPFTLKSRRPKNGAQRIALQPDPLPPLKSIDVPRISQNDLEEVAIRIGTSDGSVKIVRRHHCRYPCLEEFPGPYQPYFCGDEQLPGTPYCRNHARHTHQPLIPWRRPPPPIIDRVPAFSDLEKENA